MLRHFQKHYLSLKLQGTFCSVFALEAISVLLCCLHSINGEGGKEGGREGETSRTCGWGRGCPLCQFLL